MKSLTFILISCIVATSVLAQNTDEVRKAIDRGVNYLRQTQQPAGGWSASPRSGIGPTTIIVAGLLDAGVKPDDPMLAKALKYLEASTRDDGGVYTLDGFFQNYETCCAVSAFAKANEAVKKATGQEPYKDLLAKAAKYIRSQQYTEDRKTEPKDPNYGGVGYGGETRPDLSNTQFFLDALKATGSDADDPAIQKALVFVSRCQNLESEHNTMPFIAENSANLDGGFVYVNQPAANRSETKEESLRSYGSMTYAGLKSMVYAGLTKDDKRVKAAFDWISKHYTVTENPGRGTAGLYYYYQTMAKALTVLNLTEIVDNEGTKHRWQSDLSAHLLQKQLPDGSWINDASRQYLENDPNLVTGYALLVLSATQQTKTEVPQ
ncbi:cycloartenol synthase [Planctomycetales bacterium]|nr:cycloartenol synthase [Planctomycetales bacterium]